MKPFYYSRYDTAFLENDCFIYSIFNIPLKDVSYSIQSVSYEVIFAKNKKLTKKEIEHKISLYKNMQCILYKNNISISIKPEVSNPGTFYYHDSISEPLFKTVFNAPFEFSLNDIIKMDIHLNINKKLLKYFIKKCAAIRIHLKGILKDERGTI
jgi:hypothetical protein